MVFWFVYLTVWFVPHAKSLISGLGKISTLFFVFSTKVIIGLGSLTVAKLIAPALSIYSPLVLCPNCPYSGKPNEYKVPLQSSKMLNSAPQPTFTIGGPLYLTYKSNTFFIWKFKKLQVQWMIKTLIHSSYKIENYINNFNTEYEFKFQINWWIINYKICLYNQ